MDNQTEQLDRDWWAECTDKEQVFINALIGDGKQRQAAIAAGFSPKNASNAAYRYLKRGRVSKALEQRRNDLNGSSGTGPDAVRAALWANHQAAVVKGNLAASNRALELVGKANGMFSDKLELTGKDGAPLAPELTDAELARRVALTMRKGENQLQSMDKAGPDQGETGPILQ